RSDQAQALVTVPAAASRIAQEYAIRTAQFARVLEAGAQGREIPVDAAHQCDSLRLRACRLDLHGSSLPREPSRTSRPKLAVLAFLGLRPPVPNMTLSSSKLVVHASIRRSWPWSFLRAAISMS